MISERTSLSAVFPRSACPPERIVSGIQRRRGISSSSLRSRTAAPLFFLNHSEKLRSTPVSRSSRRNTMRSMESLERTAERSLLDSSMLSERPLRMR